MWTKSKKCDSSACVEVWPGSLRTWLRDSTQPDTVLSVANEDWRGLVADLRAGRIGKGV